MTKEEAFKLIKECREMLKSPQDTKAVSPATLKTYQQKFAFLNGRLPADVAQCKSSYYSQRAAYLHMRSIAIRKQLRELDKATGTDKKTTLATASGQDAFVARMEALGIPAMIENYRAVASATAFLGASKGVAQPTHGKRAVGRLPKGWKNELLGAVSPKSKYRVHVIAMALCGCRPSEFENGVLVERVDANTFKVTICGTKQGERTKNGKTFTTGQALRTLTLTRGNERDKHHHINPEFLLLDAALKGKDYVELTASATAMRDVVRRAGTKAFPKIKNQPTAYSLRHAFASELKAANGVDSVETAAALGHASTKTQGGYGYKKSAGGGGVVCKAEASGDIRTPHLPVEKALAKAKQKKANTANVKATSSLFASLEKVRVPSSEPIRLRKLPTPPAKPVPSFAKPRGMRP